MAGPHDYELWPVCPSEGVRERVNGLRAEPTTEPTTGLHLVSEPEPDAVVAPVPEPDPVPVTEPEPEPARRGARLRSLFGASSEAVADVDPDDVVQPALFIASRVWTSGPASKTQLRNGLPAASVDRVVGSGAVRASCLNLNLNLCRRPGCLRLAKLASALLVIGRWTAALCC
jgi:hypothetical protein